MTSHEPHDVAEAAPPVVVAVVTRDPGPWLEPCLASLADQDYPNLSVLVIDAGGHVDTLARVAAVLPSAYVRTIEEDRGFGPAANDVLEMVDGAAFYAFCHDDVILEPTVIRALVEEAFRSNAGIVGPKLVRWGAPDELVHVGMSADKAGVLSALVERGELDQEQHDAVRDVFVIPGGCTLVRADLFALLGGFDPAISLLGEDLDLCWRAQVVGARVVVVPAARVQHRESLADRPLAVSSRLLLARHRLRTVLTCYGPFHLARVLPQVVVLSLLETMYAVVSGRRTRAREQVAAWTWNLRRVGELRDRRRALHAARQLPDSEVRRLQVGGSARLRAYLRGELHAGERLRASMAELGRELSDSLGSGSRRLVFGVWAAVALVVVVGSRELLLQRLPSIAGLARFDQGPLDLLRAFTSDWRQAGLGAEAPAPTAFALLGLAGIPLLGAMGLLQQLLVLGAVPMGIIGVWRISRPLESRVGRCAAIVAYAAVPLPYDALSRGSWAGLLLYAAAPWVLGRLAVAAGGLAPTADVERAAVDRVAVVALGLVLALVAAFVPLVVILVPLVAVAIWLGGLLVGSGRSSSRAVVTALGAALVAALLHFPWSLDFALPGSEWWATAGVSSMATRPLGMAALLRFETGDVGVSSLGWALPVAAALPLVIGREWRFTWAVRCWMVALGCWALAWAGGQGHLGVELPPADVLLAPGAAALALAVALGVIAFERDLRGYRFGWRQLVSLAAGAALAVGVLPIVVATSDGRWRLPDADHAEALGFLDEEAKDDSFRVLWLGDPDDLPVAAFELVEGLAYGVSTDGPGRLTERWASPAYGATPQLADALRLAADGETDRLGRMLAARGVRYLAIVDRAAPARSGAERHPSPSGLASTLAGQLDLHQIEVDPALMLYENVAWSSDEGDTARDGDRADPMRWLAIAIQAALWVTVVVWLLRGRRHRRLDVTSAEVMP